MEYSSNCPMCEKRIGRPDRKRHFYFNSEKQVGFCHRCGYRHKGKIVLDETAPIRSEWKEKLKNPEELYDLLTTGKNSIRVSAAAGYLSSHHIPPCKAAWNYRVLLDGMFLVFPVYRGEEMIFWQKRALFEKRFINQPLVPKPLFFTDEIKTGPTVLVESWTNAVRVAPLARTVAIFGKYLDEDRARIIAQSGQKVLVLLDYGEYHNALKIERQLRRLGLNDVYAHQMPSEKDLCEISDSQVEEILDEGRKWL